MEKLAAEFAPGETREKYIANAMVSRKFAAESRALLLKLR